jgi:hypothetical protein
MIKFAFMFSIIAIPANAFDRDSSTKLMSDWQTANALCRGSSNASIVEMACDIRDNAHASLRASGMCYGMKGQHGSQYRWHVCQKTSNRS